MGIVASEKIFVDPKEEITFVIERALISEKENLIFIIPQNSILLSSPVSINILFKEISKTKKNGVIVTEDKYGTSIASKAGFVVVEKVSQITSEEWDISINKKLKYLAIQEKQKRELLSNLGLIETKSKIEEKNEGEIGSTTKEMPNKIASDFQDENLAVSDKEVKEPENKDLKINETSDEEDEVENFYKKPRKETKVVNLKGISLATGGDIRNFLNSPVDDKMLTESNFNNTMEDIPERKVKSYVGSSSFAGRDFTKQVKPESSSKGFFSNLFGGKKNFASEDELENNLVKQKRRKKIIIGSTVIGLVLLLGSSYLFAFQLSSVDVSIKFKKEDVSGTADVLLNPDVTEVSYNPVTIPTKVISEEGISLSKTGEANGVGQRGTKAKGFVIIYNLTDKPITIKKDAKLTDPTTNKTYILSAEVKLGIDEDKISNNVSIEASGYGEDYNIPISKDSTSFEVEGYSTEFASKQVYARLYNEISGGKSEEFVSVSQENIDTLKEKIMPELKTLGEGKIRNALPSGYTLISDSIKFTETSLSSLPKVDEEAKDKKFTLSIEGTYTGYAVANEDLKMIAERILSDNRNSDLEEDNNLVVDNIDLPQITSVEEVDAGVVISISTQASVGVRPTDESLKVAIAGRSMSDASNYLSSVESIENVRLNFTPSFIPEFLRTLPYDPSRISIRIR